uniref:O-fucosyltransferase family protein n=1 Tax=Odontella aurita TaxID=265563 RepID=A0A7S4N399_9STRA|mmetsp:Transcript_454/g.1376  ORF Transcript_454/g.1376 Transcript_454/m.1376 type:complete len:440 (+) Transcript_454:172-1491(+)
MPRSSVLVAFLAVATFSLIRSCKVLIKISSAFNMDAIAFGETVVPASGSGGGAEVAGTQIPRSNASLPTLALIEPMLRGGFRNQAMRFTAFVMHAVAKNISLILLPSIRFGDRWGTDKPIPFEELFDVSEWNKYAFDATEGRVTGVRLPKMVQYDPAQHYQWNEAFLTDRTPTSNPNPRHGAVTQFKVSHENATQPYAYGGGIQAGRLWWDYSRYSAERSRSGLRSINDRYRRHPVEVLIFRALQPSAKLRSVMGANLPNSVRHKDYICIHPRVESDMQSHYRCSNQERTGYQRNLSAILEAVEREMPTAPASEVFLPINQNFTRPDGLQKEQMGSNLWTLNETLTHGLWNGTVRAFELGENIVKDDPRFEGMRSTTGSVINFFLAVEAQVFVGQGASTWSVDAAAVRYHRLGANAKNYMFWKGGFTRLKGDPKPHSCD